MNADEAFVTERHPSAWVSFNSDTGQFKVYSDRFVNVALSESCDSSAAAWSNAARAIRERDARTENQT